MDGQALGKVQAGLGLMCPMWGHQGTEDSLRDQ